MSLKQECDCGHDIETHYLDPSDHVRYACTGLHCDCSFYGKVDRDWRAPVLPSNNFDESLTHSGGGRPHNECKCIRCLEWEYEQVRHALGW